jgi:hypothetical protein
MHHQMVQYVGHGIYTPKVSSAWVMNKKARTISQLHISKR